MQRKLVSIMSIETHQYRIEKISNSYPLNSILQLDSILMNMHSSAGIISSIYFDSNGSLSLTLRSTISLICLSLDKHIYVILHLSS